MLTVDNLIELLVTNDNMSTIIIIIIIYAQCI